MVYWNNNPSEDIVEELYNLLVDIEVTNEEKRMLLQSEFDRAEYSSSEEFNSRVC